MFRSGGYHLPVEEPRPQGATITIQTNSDFLGYEQAFYDVTPGLRIIFSNAETAIDGVSQPNAAPRVALFPLPHPEARHVRLLYLVRSSAADHNMAILAAPDLPRLSTACVSSKHLYSAWVPSGIALRPQSTILNHKSCACHENETGP